MLERSSAAKNILQIIKQSGAQTGGTVRVHVSAAPNRSSDTTSDSSGVTCFSCEYCECRFGTKIGLGVHKSHRHRDEVNADRMSATRPSRGTGQRHAVSSKRLWTDSETKILAKLDLELRLANPRMSEAALNRELASLFPGRSSDAIKGRKKGEPFKRALASIRDTQTTKMTVPNHTVDDTMVDTSVAPADSMSTLSSPSDPMSGELEVEPNNGHAANSSVNASIDAMIETNVETTVDPNAQSSLPEPNTDQQTDEANGRSITGATSVSSTEETGLNHVDHLILARLSADTERYARQIKRAVKVSYKVKQLLHILNMPREEVSVAAQLEKWLDSIINAEGGDDLGVANNWRKPKIREGYGKGKGLRGKRRLAEKAYLQNLYKKRGVKGVAQHVLRDIEVDGESPRAISSPSPDSMAAFWSDVFGSNKWGGERVTSTSSEESTANCLWEAITIEDIARTELARGKAKGPDGVSVEKWKSVPRSVRALFYNVVMYHGVVLERLACARTVLIPKCTNPSTAGEYRPIGITSVIRRQLHRVFVKKLNAVRPFDSRQVAFRNGVDGCSNNLATLRTVIGLRRWKHDNKDLHIISLDLKKAYDSVSFSAIFQTLSDLECPTVFVNYLKRVCSMAKTSLELGNGESKAVRVGQGVFQGDPLSGIIFNHIIDRALKKLDEDLGYLCGGDRVTCTAFADDINIIGDSIVGTQSNINTLLNELAEYGLEVNPSKCLSLSMVRDGHRKAAILDTSDAFTVNGSKIKSIGPSTKWKYLGIHWTGEKIDTKLPDISPKLNRVKEALLRPQQKLELVTKIILPTIYHQAVLGNATQEELSSIDKQVRNMVREVMHFPKDIPISYIHAPVRCGGMGIPELLVRIPLLRYVRMKRFADSDAGAAPQFENSIAYRYNKGKVKDFLHENDLGKIANGEIISKYYLTCLEKNFATKGLSEAFYSRQSRAWCNTMANEISGSDFIKYHLISSGSLPTLARRAWGRPGMDVRCRHGCGSTESNHHVQQVCTLTEGGRSLRHNRVLDYIYDRICVKFQGNFSVEKEPHLQTIHGLRKPDLVLHGGNDAIVIDLNIVGNERLKEASGEKVTKYRDLPGFDRVIKQRYGVNNVSFYAITISYSGIIERSSRELLRELNFTHREIFRMTTSVLRGSWLNWFRFKKIHQQRFFDLRNQN